MHRVGYAASFIYRLLTALSVCLAVTFNADAQAAPQPLLWQVQGKESSARVYLFGSLHYGSDTFYPLPDVVLAAYRNSDALAVELDIDALVASDVQEKLREYGVHSGKQHLMARIGKDSWEQLDTISASMGVNAQQFSQLRPWLVAMQLTNLQLSRSGYQQALGLDKYFLTTARGKKPILELESLDEQMKLFNKLSDAEQLAFLQMTLDDYATGKESLAKLAEAWYQGDEQALNTLVFSAFKRNELGKKLYQFIFVKRNQQMLAAIDTYIKSSQKIFLVVGIGHMLGEDGLVALLEQQGYRVQRIMPADD